MIRMGENVEIDVEIIKTTGSAVLVSDGDTEEWIPLSLIQNKGDYEYEEGTICTIEIPEWVAIDKGFA
jgi:hypothetical protein